MAHSPIPPDLLPMAARLWRRHFGYIGIRGFDARNGTVIVARGRVEGVIGFRDNAGGFAIPGRGVAAFLAGALFRPAPPTADLVIDGIAVAAPRQGTGRALIAHALAEARRRNRPGLRAEVTGRNPDAIAFYQALGFVEESRGRYGWPWTGQVLVLRLPVSDACR